MTKIINITVMISDFPHTCELNELFHTNVFTRLRSSNQCLLFVRARPRPCLSVTRRFSTPHAMALTQIESGRGLGCA